MDKIPTHTKILDWNTSTVSRILQNEKYVGRYVWGRYKYVRNPTTKKKVKVKQPKDQWLERRMDELRVIEDDLWQRVKIRFKESKGVFPERRGKKAYSRGNESYVKQHPHNYSQGLWNAACAKVV
jgi:hypothetical protein